MTDARHCAGHDDMLSEQSKLTSSASTLRWIVGISLPVITIAITLFMANNNKALDDIAGDIKDVKALLVKAQIDNAVINERVTAIEEKVAELERLKGQ